MANKSEAEKKHIPPVPYQAPGWRPTPNDVWELARSLAENRGEQPNKGHFNEVLRQLPASQRPYPITEEHIVPASTEQSVAQYLLTRINELGKSVLKGKEAVKKIREKGFSHQKEPKGYPVLGRGRTKGVWNEDGVVIFRGRTQVAIITHDQIATKEVTIDVPPRPLERVQSILRRDWPGNVLLTTPQRKGVSIKLAYVPKPIATAGELVETATAIHEGKRARRQLETVVTQNASILQPMPGFGRHLTKLKDHVL